MLSRALVITILLFFVGTTPYLTSTFNQIAIAVELDVPYEATPPEVVDEMLQLAKIKSTDVVYDLGCGDGRIVIAAAKKYGVKGVGVDIDPARIREAQANAKAAGVEDKVTFVEQDLFETKLQDATVVMIFLNYDVNLKLRPKLLKELKPGSRVVSSTFDMGDWKPDRTSLISGRNIYCWIIRTSL